MGFGFFYGNLHGKIFAINVFRKYRYKRNRDTIQFHVHCVPIILSRISRNFLYIAFRGVIHP